MSWSSVLALSLTLLPSCDGYDANTDEAHEMHNTGSEPQSVVPVIRGPGTSRIPVTFTIGSRTFVVPTEVVGIQVSHQEQSVDFVTLGIYFPEFDGYSQASFGELTHRIQISLKAVARKVPLPNTRKEAKALFGSLFPDTLFVSSKNDSLNLVELIPEGDRNYIVYRRTDDYIRPGDGTISYVICSTVPPTLCTGHGYLLPDVAVKYRIHKQQIDNWKMIDTGVFEYLESISAEVK